jgi:hypothetical protein
MNFPARDVFAQHGVLWGAVGRNHPGPKDHHLGAGVAQARRFDVWPSLLRAVVAYLKDVEPVSLGERCRHAGFDLRSKAKKNGQSGSDKPSKSNG